MIDVSLLKVMKHRDWYNRLQPLLPLSLDEKTRQLLTDYGKYFDKFPDHDVIDFGVFCPALQRWHPTLTKEQYQQYEAMLLRNATQELDEATRGSIMSDLYEINTATQIANLCMQFDQGTLSLPLMSEITKCIDMYRTNAKAEVSSYVMDDIEDLLEQEEDNSGVSYRLECLRSHLRSLRGGDFGIVAARPDKGKTTFLASELTYWASQIKDGRTVLWLNNEGPGSRIKPRLYQAALGKTIPELVHMKKQGVLKKAYTDAIGGDPDRIKIVDVHGMHCGTIENILRQHNPAVIVYDMIDNITGFGGESRRDLTLERMYQWARERSVEYNAIGIATSQTSADAEGEMYPTYEKLKDSKTGKQGACDFIIMIGAVHDQMLQGSRFISCPKNKLRMHGHPQDPRTEVLFKPGIARFVDMPTSVEVTNEQI